MADLRTWRERLIKHSVSFIGGAVIVYFLFAALICPSETVIVGATLLGPVIAIFAVLLQYQLLEGKRASDGLKGLKCEIIRNKKKVDELVEEIDHINTTHTAWTRLEYCHFDKTAFINFEVSGLLLQLSEHTRDDLEMLYRIADSLNKYSEHIFEMPHHGDIASAKIDLEYLELYAKYFNNTYDRLAEDGFLAP